MDLNDSIISRYADHVSRQQAAWEAAMAEEDFDAVIVHSGSQIVSFLDDYHYPFRPNPHFLAWLPLTRHDESVLIIRPGEKPILYYHQPEDYWYQPPSDPSDWWARHFDVRPVREAGEWHAGVPMGREAYIGDAPELDAEGDVNPAGLLHRLHLERTRKTPYELACLEQSSDIAARAHLAAEVAFREGASEFSIHQAYLQAAQLEDAELPYGSIVALNEHSAVLHYQRHDRQAPETMHSFLIDAGATVNAYCSDITRTHAAQPGEFADMIAAMDELQRGLCREMTAGTDYRDLHLKAHTEIATVLHGFGIIKVNAFDAVECGLSSVFFPHGLGHFLGLQTHDVAGLIQDATGREIPRPQGHPFLRLTRVLEPGNVLTVEPGLYFIDSLLARWAEGSRANMIDWDKVDSLRHFGGIRIEDNVVVTDAEPQNLTRASFDRL